MSNVIIEGTLEKKRQVMDELDAIHAMDIDANCKSTLQVLIFAMSYLDEIGILSKPFPQAVTAMTNHYFSFSHPDALATMLGGDKKEE